MRGKLARKAVAYEICGGINVKTVNVGTRIINTVAKALRRAKNLIYFSIVIHTINGRDIKTSMSLFLRLAV